MPAKRTAATPKTTRSERSRAPARARVAATPRPQAVPAPLSAAPPIVDRAALPSAPPRHHLELIADDGGTAPPSTPSTTPINQWGYFAAPDPIGGWTVDLTSQAIAQHKTGQFSLSGVLADDMAAWSWISDCLAVRSQIFTTAPTRVVAAGRGEARRCADFMREVLPDVLPLSILQDLHRNYVMMGFSVAAMDWVEYKDGADRVWLPRIKPWQPQLLYYQQFADADSVDLGALVATTLNRGLVRVDAGESRWVVFSQSRLKPWLRGAVNTLGEVFLGDTFNFRDRMAFQDRFGRGILKLHHPVSWRDEEIWTAANSLRAGGGGGVMPCPTEPRTGAKIVDVDLVQADATGFKTFESTADYMRDRFLITLLGQDMTSKGGSGGYAQARVHENGLWRVFEADGAVFGDAALTVVDEDTGDETAAHNPRVKRIWQPRDGVIRTQISKWIALWNFGSMDLAPYVYWDVTAPEDTREQEETEAERIKAIGTAMQAVATAIEKLSTAGEDVDMGFVLEQMGIRLRRPTGETAVAKKRRR